jgi:hypothetical protein
MQVQLLAVLLALTLLSPAVGVQFFVSTTGSDTAPGTENEPFATIARALVAARSQPSVPVEVFVFGGIYRLSSSLEFGPADSRAPSAPLSITAQPRSGPVFVR